MIRDDFGFLLTRLILFVADLRRFVNLPHWSGVLRRRWQRRRWNLQRSTAPQQFVQVTRHVGGAARQVPAVDPPLLVEQVELARKLKEVQLRLHRLARQRLESLGDDCSGYSSFLGGALVVPLYDFIIAAARMPVE